MIAVKPNGRRSKKPTEEELAMMYGGMTAKEVGEYYGVTESTVRKWLAEYRKESRRNAEENQQQSTR